MVSNQQEDKTMQRDSGVALADLIGKKCMNTR